MRLLFLSLVLANAALMSAADPASAQSPTSYPWCARSGDNSNVYCYYTSKEQCRRTMSGIGVLCFGNPYYRQSPPQSFDARASCQEQAQASGPQSQWAAYFDQCMIASSHHP
jgi:hypothetical protein